MTLPHMTLFHIRTKKKQPNLQRQKNRSRKKQWRKETEGCKPLDAVGARVNGLRLVDVGNALAEVEAGIHAGVHTLDADERLLLVLVAEATAVAKEHSAGVQLCLHFQCIKTHTQKYKTKKHKQKTK